MRTIRFNTDEEFKAWLNRNRPEREREHRYVATEEQEQMALIEWRDTWVGQFPELALLYHCPNGGFRRKVEAVKFAKMGVLPGVPDFHLPVARHGAHSLYIELKAFDGTISDYQICRAIQFAEQGNLVAFAYGWQMASNILFDYLKGDT